MGILNKKATYHLFKMACHTDQNNVISFNLNKRKMIVGSSDQCDITIEDEFVSHYHAILFIEDTGVKIIDLGSINGFFINGRKLKESYVGLGDVLRFGKTEFHIEETVAENPPLDRDSISTKNLSENEIDNYIPEERPIDDLVLIDGEYCDIIFHDDKFTPVNESPINQIKVADYIDTDEKKFPDKEIENLTIQKGGQSLQVTILSNGHILSLDYFPIKNSTIYLSSKKKKKNTILLETLSSTKKLPFIQVENKKIKLYKLNDFDSKNITNSTNNVFYNNDSISIADDDVISFSQQTVQIIIQIVDTPPQVRSAPFFTLDANYNKPASIAFSIYFIIWIIFTFLVDLDEVKKDAQKKIAIIYKKAIKSEITSRKKSAGSENNNPNKTGVTENTNPKKQLAEAKVGKRMKPAKNTKSMKQKVSASQKKVIKAPKIKTYNFKMDNSVSSFLNTSKSITDVKINNNTKSAAISNNFDNNFSNTSALKSNSKARVGNLGSSLNGRFSTTSGAKGLGSKKGVDTTYVDPKTVVLGSMDPELIRKILKEYLPQFHHCYQQELQHNETVKGVVKLDFRIGKTGAVQNIAIKAKKAKFSKSGKNCMAKVMKMIRFPKPKGGGIVDVTQPLNFFAEKTTVH